ncbi:MAG: polyprenyl synthetase family protein [Lachnospiraceae bacterium]|nr:polyprenyl synthetase family protein [Lachnospiraceae bacterium]
MNFNETLQEKRTQVQAVIREYLPEEGGFQKTLLEAMNYSMLAGGKRLRPLLMQETYELFGGTGQVVQPFMAAMEMIHTHSLIHDDLPAMDNDEYRRGMKTTHVVYGEAMGILAGDGLLNYAYETAVRAFAMEPENKNLGRAIRILAQKTGIRGMIGGQSVDVEMEGQPLEEDQLDFIYRLKTSALIEGSMMIGAVLAGADEEAIGTVEAAARDLGLAFQIQDDILDVTSTTQVLGKSVKSDEKNNKTTYVSLKGLEQAQKDVEVFSERAIARMDSLPFRNQFLRELMLQLIHRKF